MYGNKPYRVQQEKDYLHIIVFENGKRKKIDVSKIEEGFWEPGTKEDYIFNGWFEYYEEIEFLSFASAEINWLKN